MTDTMTDTTVAHCSLLSSLEVSATHLRATSKTAGAAAAAEHPGQQVKSVTHLLMSSTRTPRLAEEAANPFVWMPRNTFSTVERSTTAGPRYNGGESGLGGGARYYPLA